MLKRYVLLALSCLSLAACDAAQDIAGDAIEGEVRNQIVQQCQQVSESAGIAAARVGDVCECAAETYVNDPDLTMDDVSRERIVAIVNECAASTDGPVETAEQTTPAE